MEECFRLFALIVINWKMCLILKGILNILFPRSLVNRLVYLSSGINLGPDTVLVLFLRNYKIICVVVKEIRSHVAFTPFG